MPHLNLQYTFQNEKLLKRALTHSSYANENKMKNTDCNERMEFLGDSVLNFICAEYLFKHFKRSEEGDLSKIRAALVCEQALHTIAQELSLGQHILMGKGEENTGGRGRPSILADAVESVIAAIYLDGGLDKAQEFVVPFLDRHLEDALKGRMFSDYKTNLQEIVQKNPGELLRYELVDESGPDHRKNFIVKVYLNSNCIGEGQGKSKKEAEQMAAKSALALMGY